MGFLESSHPARRGVEEDPVAGLGGLDPDVDGEVCFPGSGRSKKDNVLRFGKEHARAQVRDQVPVGGGLMVEVEVFEGLVTGNRAALIRSAAPEASRSETSLESTAARYSSWDHPASRA